MRPEKKLIVDEVQKQIGGSPFLLLTDYTGLTVTHFTDLRKRLMGVSAECTLIRQADHAWWVLAGALGLITPESVSVLGGNLRARG